MAESATRVESGAEEAQFASIIASSHDAILGMTRSGKITSCNPAAAALYGASVGEIIGRRVEEFIPQDRRADEAALLHRIINGDTVEQYRTQRVRPDSSVIDLWSSISPILDPTGAIIGAATVAREVSPLQQAYDRFEGRVGLQRNEAAEATARLDLRADEHRAGAREAADRYELQVERERAQAREDTQRTGAAAEFHQQVRQHRLAARDAARRLDARVDQHRAEVHVAADHYEEQVRLERRQAQDAADRFEAQVDLERASVQAAQSQFEAQRAEAQGDRDHLQAQLEQSQRLEVLGQLAGGVAHDFNNLLAVILNYAAFVAEELDDDSGPDLAAAAHDVGQIQRAAERATALTQQLLAFARCEVVQPRVLDLNQVVAEVRQLLDRTIGEDIVLRTHLTADLWPVLADSGQMEQILVNLAVNARDAMTGGGVLTIDTANIMVDAEFIAEGSPLQPGRHVRLRVRDTGTGMSPELVARIFQPFFSTKAPGAGTGLGLATVCRLIRHIGGSIEIESREGVGTTFAVMLPVTDQAAVSVQADERPGPAGAGETVLVVEDEEAMREVTERILTRGGYHVITAAHGAEALDIAASYDGAIDLLITDVVMPNMLGKEVAEKVLTLRPDVQVLYMSGYAEPVLASRSRLDRDVHLLQKPFTAAKLITMTGQILGVHAAPAREA